MTKQKITPDRGQLENEQKEVSMHAYQTVMIKKHPQNPVRNQVLQMLIILRVKDTSPQVLRQDNKQFTLPDRNICGSTFGNIHKGFLLALEMF